MRKILYSPGYGAGWSSWNSGDVSKYMLTYQPIIEFLENGGKFKDEDCNAFKEHNYHPLIKQLIKECKEKFGVNYVCISGARDLKVAIVYGSVRIKDRDGYESYEESTEWM